MESPHLYDNIEYKKDMSMKLKSMYSEVGEYDINSDLASNEVSLNLQNLIDDNQQSLMSESLITDLQGLNVDKNMANYPRGIGGNAAGMGCLTQPISNNNNMYGPLTYVPQPVHGGAQYERSACSDRLSIKEEPYESSPDSSHDYPSCQRINSYNGYGNYPMGSSVISSSDAGIIKSPHKSAMVKAGQKKMSSRNDEEYRKRRERNNIAVRKSREKAKLRTRETEERVKLLTDENRSLKDQCKNLCDELAVIKSVFTSMQLECLPEPYATEIRTQVERITNHPTHALLGM